MIYIVYAKLSLLSSSLVVKALLLKKKEIN
jgi:hypothetical protein